MVSFRGRIFIPDHGYAPRTLLELHLRAGIGSILSKPLWWVKWQCNEGGIRDKWLGELEELVVQQTLYWTTKNWENDELSRVLMDKFNGLPESGDEERRTFIEKACAHIDYNFIWHEDWWEEEEITDEMREAETEDEFTEANEQKESYGQILWYFLLVLLNRQVKSLVEENEALPDGPDFGTDDSIESTRDLIYQVRQGHVTKESFLTWCEDGDARTQIMDGLWFHVERVIEELDAIRECVATTLEQVIAENNLKDANVSGFISPGPVPETWMSDSIIPSDLKTKFTDEVRVLEDIPDADMDWHPGSDNQVLDLMHPSLYCCVFGKTMAVGEVMSPRNSTPSTSTVPTALEQMQSIIFSGKEAAENKHRGEAKYQWIPSDFAVNAEGHVQILSYINNLHPVKFESMYESIASIFEKFVPMFDKVLSCLANERSPSPLIKIPNLYDRDSTNEIPARPNAPEILQLQPDASTPYSLKGTSVQVIVKIAEIHLTPEKPAYPGGSWHIEGSDAEQIVSTGIYYFGCENITESKLSFRVIVQEPSYQQCDYLGIAATYGLENEERLVQNLGAAVAREDRCVVFPNTLQHKVEAFELADKTKPGVRKILAFFLVDPTKQIPSTATIPPQQADWVQAAQQPILSGLPQLPEEVLQTQMRQLLDSGMTLEQAKQYRLELMDERRPVRGADDAYELFFSLCEH
ncbi:hypothetical protein Poli38472_009090 [Pythium oligandrum]|uniref:DUF4246 domain-containing protein n=1 Tax=Pythium oligandrum TaxID=41045 RepID=A0A8K1CL23_PYTOL|nr:hypothetical protein Poli38472_009090 [Pythium oligandrum]|eukprot:TMW64923.1 hypothetical protein Poli38472_009090 [Pythium oligandrum]